jgi:hypothetical protein
LGDFLLDVEGPSNWILSGLGDVDLGTLKRIVVVVERARRERG